MTRYHAARKYSSLNVLHFPSTHGMKFVPAFLLENSPNSRRKRVKIHGKEKKNNLVIFNACVIIRLECHLASVARIGEIGRGGGI